MTSFHFCINEIIDIHGLYIHYLHSNYAVIYSVAAA